MCATGMAQIRVGASLLLLHLFNVKQTMLILLLSLRDSRLRLMREG